MVAIWSGGRAGRGRSLGACWLCPIRSATARGAIWSGRGRRRRALFCLASLFDTRSPARRASGDRAASPDTSRSPEPLLEIADHNVQTLTEPTWLSFRATRSSIWRSPAAVAGDVGRYFGHSATSGCGRQCRPPRSLTRVPTTLRILLAVEEAGLSGITVELPLTRSSLRAAV